MWRRFCEHTEKVEEEYWKRDGLVEDVVEEIMINFSDDSGDESTEDDLEPNDNDLKSREFTSATDTKPCCSKQLQLEHNTEHTMEYTSEYLESVLPLNLMN